MSMTEFIEKNRAELDSAINKALNFVPRSASCDCRKSGTDHIHENGRSLNNSERRLWVLNDAGLYAWARSEGVRI